jgi:hypothetical protein
MADTSNCARASSEFGPGEAHRRVDAGHGLERLDRADVGVRPVEADDESAGLGIEHELADLQAGTGPALEELACQLSGAAGGTDPPGHDGRDEGARRQLPAELGEEHDLLGRSTAHAAERVGDAEGEPAHVGAARPGGVVDGQRGRTGLGGLGQLADLRQRQLLRQELLRDGADLTLLGSQDEDHRGSPRTRSPMMFF